MPKKVLPSAEDFARLGENLKRKGFRPINRAEFKNDSLRLGLIAPPRVARNDGGAEAGFRYDANGLAAKIWTTYLIKEGTAREQDAGWVIIAEGDMARYFSHPLHRTENFLTRLWQWGQVARQRVMHRPLCPECHAFMHIRRGKALKSRYWACMNSKRHADLRPVFSDWDVGLSPKAHAFVEGERALREQYRARAPEGVPGTAMLNRQTWEAARPHNLIPPQ